MFQYVSFNNIKAITENTVPILMAFYIGSLSDKFGRKIFLGLCMLGRLFGKMFLLERTNWSNLPLSGAVGNLITAIYLEEMNKWWWLALVLPVQNISGGSLTFVMMTYSFIADNSSPRWWINSFKLEKT